MKYFDRRFMMPILTILIGAGMVFFDRLDGAVWAGMAGTLATGFMGLSGYQTRVETQHTHDTEVAILKASIGDTK